MSELVYGKIDLLNTSLGKITLQYTGTVYLFPKETFLRAFMESDSPENLNGLWLSWEEFQIKVS